MKRENVIVSLIISISLFGIQVCYAGQSSPPIFENAVTLELEFTVDDLPEYYGIYYPGRAVVADNGDIILSNNGKLMIYDLNGNLKIVTGQVFESGNLLTSPQITETGYTTVDYLYGGVTGNISYNLYDNEYNFVKKEVFNENKIIEKILEDQNWRNFTGSTIYGYGPDERLLGLSGQTRGGSQIGTNMQGIFYENENILKTVRLFKRNWESGFEYETRLKIYGEIFYELLSNRKVVSIHTGTDRFEENDNWHYELRVNDLRTDERQVIQVPYIPVTFPDSVINKQLLLSPGLSDDLRQNRIASHEKRRQVLVETRYYPPLRKLVTDQTFVFAFSFLHISEKGYLADVIDSESGKVISKVYFPMIPQIIKNGYAYQTVLPRLSRGGMEFSNANPGEYPVIEKYRIDPAVYGK